MKKITFAVALFISFSAFSAPSAIRSDIEADCIYAALRNGDSRDLAQKKCRCFFESFAQHLTLAEYVAIQESDDSKREMALIMGSRHKLVKADSDTCMSK